jgi:glycine dehydrogenase subunit 1
MLAAIGAESIDELFAGLPNGGRMPALAIPGPASEIELAEWMGGLASANRTLPADRSFLGGGAYRHFVPALVRAVVSRPEFYAPYALSYSEVHQGTLQALYEYQSLMVALTGMECSNASLYDGASACAEGVMLARRLTGRGAVVVSAALNAGVRQVVRTYATGPGLDVRQAPYDSDSGATTGLEPLVDEHTAAVVIQYPNAFGVLEDVAAVAELARSRGALLVVQADPVALAMLRPPGELGADIVVGEGQPLGLALSCGGLSLGFLTTRLAYLDEVPGAVVEVARDQHGRRGFAVRDYGERDRSLLRERARSNVGTTSTLPAIAAAVYLAALGPHGLRRVAELAFHRTHYLAESLAALPGCRVRFSGPFFREFAVSVGTSADELADRVRARGFLAGLPLGRWYPELGDCLLLTCGEGTPRAAIDQFVATLSGEREGGAAPNGRDAARLALREPA